MKNTRFAGLAIRIATFYFIVAGTCHTIQPQVQFRMVHDTLVVISVTADNQGPFDFVLDTGADITIVDPSLAAALSLRSDGRARQTTLAGVRSLAVSSLASLAVGPASAENVRVMVQDLAGLRTLDPHIEGIVGQNFLARFNYLLDYQNRVVSFESAREIQESVEGDRVPIEMVGSRMMVASEGRSRGRVKLHLMLDSGANSAVLLPAASKALGVSSVSRGTERTSGQNVAMRVGNLHSLTVGSQQFYYLAVALPASAPAERIGDGLLPAVLFQALYVNNRAGYVVFNPRPSKKSAE